MVYLFHTRTVKTRNFLLQHLLSHTFHKTNWQYTRSRILPKVGKSTEPSTTCSLVDITTAAAIVAASPGFLGQAPRREQRCLGRIAVLYHLEPDAEHTTKAEECPQTLPHQRPAAPSPRPWVDHAKEEDRDELTRRRPANSALQVSGNDCGGELHRCVDLIHSASLWMTRKWMTLRVVHQKV